jgi:hypothetical protein
MHEHRLKLAGTYIPPDALNGAEFGIIVDDTAQGTKSWNRAFVVDFAAVRESPSLRRVFKPTYRPRPRFDASVAASLGAAFD